MSKLKKKQIFQTKEICWNLVNAGLAGSLVLLGALTNGEISAGSFFYALVIALIAAVNQFKDYWATERKQYSTKLFSFIKL